MKKLLCGIDGGGTKTTILVADENGKVVAVFSDGSVNHYAVGPTKARETYRNIHDGLVSRLGRLPDAIYIGSSALDGAASDEETAEITGGVFSSVRVQLHSDVWIALLGFSKGESGAILISGTGSMACGIDKEGTYHTSGGWGHTLGDEGSGYHLALMGIQAALRAHDGISAPTALTNRLKSHFQLANLSDLINLVYNPPIEKSRIASFAKTVEETALSGDIIAMNLLEEEVQWLYLLALSITRKCATQRLGMCGSMLTQSPVISTRLKEKLSANGIEAQFPRFKPEVGALFAAFGLVGIPLTEAVILNLQNHFSTPQCQPKNPQ